MSIEQEVAMPKYLITASYSPEGARGLLKEGGTSRRSAIGKLVGDAGGSVECFYYAFGSDDVYVIIELPDSATVAALALTLSASGAVAVRTTVLLTPEEIDQAAGKTVDYRPPGA
jgi:uncharacterized protein with GYD domain